MDASPTVTIRDFSPGDERALWVVFHSAVHQTAAARYTIEQRRAWAPEQPDWSRWSARLRDLRPYVVEHDGMIVGYGDLQPSGYIDHFYVHGDHARTGVGRRLMNHIQGRARERGLTRLFADVSLTAEPFFCRFGFTVTERKTVVVSGIALDNVRMTKPLDVGAGSPP